MDHYKHTKSAPRNRASLIVLIMLAFLLMVAAVVLVISMPDDEALKLSTESTAATDTDMAGFACEVTEAQQIYPFGSGVMKLSNDRIAMIDIEGAEKFAVDVDFSAPFCVQNNGLFFAADRDGHAYVMLNATGELYRGTLTGRISGASISSDGYLAIVQDQSDSTGLVTIFQPQSGKELFYCEFPESGYVLSVSFPEGESCFDVALVNTAASTARPIIKRYSLDGQQLGQRIPDLTELYPLIAYDVSKNPVLCGSSNLTAVSYDQDALIWTRSFQQIITVRTTPAGLLVLATEKQDGRCNLYSLQKSGQSSAGTAIGETITNLDVSGTLAAMGSGTHVIIADSETGEIILDRDMQAEVIRVGFADSRSLTVITRTGVKRLNVPQ